MVPRYDSVRSDYTKQERLGGGGDNVNSALNDMVIRGALIGLLADAVKLLVNLTAYLLGFTNVVFWRIAASYLLQASQLHSPAALIVGAVIDVITSAALGVAFVWLTNHFIGRQRLAIKGVGFGLLTWLVLLGSLGPTLERKLPQSISGWIVTFVAHTVFGLAIAYFSRLIDYRQTAD